MICMAPLRLLGANVLWMIDQDTIELFDEMCCRILSVGFTLLLIYLPVCYLLNHASSPKR
jgi:hypothetical protein